MFVLEIFGEIMPIQNPQIENILGLKALAWDYQTRTFVSPARPDFIWSRAGLQVAGCEARGCKIDIIPNPECSCGMYAAYDIDIINEYTDTSPISPIFLVEASGKTVIHEEGWRSKEMTIHMVTVPEDATPRLHLIAAQAADYFQVPVYSLEVVTLVMDLQNIIQLPYYVPRGPYDRKSLFDLLKQRKAEVNA